jgi:thiamine-phosphate pyrophosphorylase
MKLIVVSSENFFDGEVKIVNRLFEAGLQIFHLRKPQGNESEFKSFLSGIPIEFRSRIALHSHHGIAEEYNIGRVHFTETVRRKMEGDLLNKIPKSYSLTTSFHDEDEAVERADIYDYFFLGPVYDSISKIGYLGKTFSRIQECKGKAIAIGGIQKEKLEEIGNMGFGGAAISGALWENRSSAVETFIKTREYAEGVRT